MRIRNTFAVVLVALLAVSAGSVSLAAGAPAHADVTSDDASPGEATAEPAVTSAQESAARPDPEEDVIGWENGYWYDEELDVDNSDGLTDEELDAVVGRAMARVEEVRQVEFQRDVPVNVISREEYREQRGGGQDVPSSYRQRENAIYESLFMVGEDENAVAVGEQNSGATVGGFYSPSEDSITIISENPDTPKMDEITLSQELFHALQDNQFGTSSFAFAPQEAHNAADGIVEGDGNYVDYLYEQRCNSDWNCLQPKEDRSGDSPNIHLGMYLLSFQPYSDGPAFVQERYEEGGWEAVNDVYENPPASTEQVIHPEKYRQDTPTSITIDDKSEYGWNRVSVRGSPDHSAVGEAGIFSMFYYPTIETNETQLIENEYLTDGRSESGTDPYNYDHPYSDGWDGDRMITYTNGQKTGYVWQTEWDSEADAQEFREAYVDLLEYHGGSSVTDSEDTYRIADGPYADAFEVTREGSTVTIVNAPSTDELSAVHDTSEGSDDGGDCWWYCY